MSISVNNKKCKIAAIVILYNPCVDVVNNIKTYINYVDLIILVDNTEEKEFSEYASCYIVDTLSKIMAGKVKYIPLNKNYGIAKALNIGIKEAAKEKITYVITMDQDSKFKNNIISVYEKFLNQKEYGKYILTPMYDTGRNQGKKKHVLYEKMNYTMQSANLFNSKIFDDIGFFKEDFFIDVVDYEYCLRAKQKGYQIIRCNKALLKHEPASGKEKKLGCFKLRYGYASSERYYYQIRNLLWTSIYYKNFSMFKWVIIKLLKILFLFPDKTVYLWMAGKAVSNALHNKLGKLDEKQY